MRDDEERRRREVVAAERGLDARVRALVDGRGRLVEDEDPRPPEDRAREAEELLLAGREVGAAVVDGRVDTNNIKIS